MDILIKQELKSLYNMYGEIHSKLNSLEQEVQSLLTEHRELGQELVRLRANEKKLINKIEEELNRSLLPEEIISIINE